jgi:hypothetical protein
VKTRANATVRKRHGSTVSTATFRIGILFEGVA